jgi:hypothetical protein
VTTTLLTPSDTLKELPGLAEKAQTAPEAGPLTTFTASDLLSMTLPEPKWAVPNIIPQGLSVLAGRPKLGKSWLALDLAIAVAAGVDALDWVRPTQGGVLYLALEDTRRRLQDRLRKIMTYLGLPGELPTLHLANSWTRQDRGGLDAIERWVENHPGTRWVIVDVWKRFRPARKAKSDIYSEDYDHASEVKALADKMETAITILHHTRKGESDDFLEDLSGSNGLPGAADGVLGLRRERGRLDASLHVTGRDIEEAELALKFDKDGGVWEYQGKAEEVRLSRERAAVLAVLGKAKGPMKPKDIATHLNEDATATRRLVWKMGKEGQLKVLEGGYYALAV